MGGFVVAVPRRGALTPEVIESVRRASEPRSPDGVHHVVVDGLLLVQCRFATRDTERGETLPKSDPSGKVWIAKRGYLTNFERLRTLLRRKVDRSVPLHTDADVMLAAYLVYGPDCGGRLEGEFTAVIWDGRTREVVTIRDHHGRRGCYLYDAPDYFVVASEPAQILAFPNVPLDLDDHTIVDMLSGDPVEYCRTLYSAIRRPLPASVTRTTTRSTTTSTYWRPPVPDPCPPSAQAYRAICAETLQRFERAVYAMTRVDGAVVCDLSGGLDSSAIYGMLRSLESRERLQVPVIGLSQLYPSLDCDESTYIEAVREKWPGPWVAFDDSVAAPPGLDDRTWLMSSTAHPIAPRGKGLVDAARWMAEGGHRVVIAGDGGDELFWSARVPLAAGFRLVSLRHLWWASFKNPAYVAERLRHEVIRPRLPARIVDRYRSLSSREVPESLSGLTRRAEALRAESLASNYDLIGSTLSPPASLAAAGIEDAVSLRYAHEVRLPFQEAELVTRTVGLPLLTHRWNGRWRTLQKDSFVNLYPTLVRARNDKAEFSARRFGVLGDMAARIKPLADRGLIDEEATRRSLAGPTRRLRRGQPPEYEYWSVAAAHIGAWLGDCQP